MSAITLLINQNKLYLYSKNPQSEIISGSFSELWVNEEKVLVGLERPFSVRTGTAAGAHAFPSQQTWKAANGSANITNDVAEKTKYQEDVKIISLF